ncbi:MAG: glycosyltransferase family 2 protein [Thermomonas sp.]|nr:glycosyltransferase family 2 protein [Thermomonas sp.]
MDMTDRKNSVCAVIVTYHPEINTLRTNIERCKEQVERVYVFDNGSGIEALDAALAAGDDVVIHQAPDNVGLAAGLNQGVAFAKRSGFDFVLLLDQDSLPAPDMVPSLLAAYAELSKKQRVAAVGATAVDVRNGLAMPFVRIKFPFNQKIYAADTMSVQCDFLITSGSLVPLSVLDCVGNMDEGLFIDNVDLDWCFRAVAQGFSLFGVGSAHMGHAIGDALSPSHFQKGGAFVHKPIRLYYIMRNRVLLYRRKTTLQRWIFQDVLRIPFKFLRMVLLHSPRGQYLGCMLKGLRDGILGRYGPAPK